MNPWLIVSGLAALLADVCLVATYRGHLRHVSLWTLPLFIVGMALLLTGLR
jgi:hypothetical protein